MDLVKIIINYLIKYYICSQNYHILSKSILRMLKSLLKYIRISMHSI